MSLSVEVKNRLNVVMGNAAADEVASLFNCLSGLTPGVAVASMGVVLGADKDIATITSATITTLTSTTGNITNVACATETITAGASTAAAGNATGNAGALPAGTSSVYPTTGADDTKGVVVSVSDQVSGRLLFIGNGVSNKILKVYPPSGGTINGASADAAFSSASGKGVILYCLSGAGNTWLAW